jgi:hypothetical protein
MPAARSFAIDQVSRLLALPMDYRRIAFSGTRDGRHVGDPVAGPILREDPRTALPRAQPSRR